MNAKMVGLMVVVKAEVALEEVLVHQQVLEQLLDLVEQDAGKK